MPDTVLVVRPRWIRLAGWLHVQCPYCGDLIAREAGTYGVTADGLVTPTVRCARIGCGFDAQLKLSGWSDSPTGTVVLAGAAAGVEE